MKKKNILKMMLSFIFCIPIFFSYIQIVKHETKNEENISIIENTNFKNSYMNGHPGIIESLGFEFSLNQENDYELHWKWWNPTFREYTGWWHNKNPILEFIPYDHHGKRKYNNKFELNATIYGFDPQDEETGKNEMSIPLSHMLIKENFAGFDVKMYYMPLSSGNTEIIETPTTSFNIPFNKNFNFSYYDMLETKINFSTNSVVLPAEIENGKTFLSIKYYDKWNSIIEENIIDVTSELSPYENFNGKEYVITNDIDKILDFNVSNIEYSFYLETDGNEVPLFYNNLSRTNELETQLSIDTNDDLNASIKKLDHNEKNDPIKFVGINTNENSIVPDTGTIKSWTKNEIEWKSGIDFNINYQTDETVVLNFILLDQNQNYIDKISRKIYLGDYDESHNIILDFNKNEKVEYSNSKNLIVNNSRINFNLFSNMHDKYPIDSDVASFYLNEDNLSNKSIVSNTQTLFKNISIPENFNYGFDNNIEIKIKDKNNNILASHEQEINIININDNIYKQDDVIYIELFDLKGIDKIVIKNNDETLSTFDNINNRINFQIDASLEDDVSIEYYSNNSLHSTQFESFEKPFSNNSGISGVGITGIVFSSLGGITLIIVITIFIIKKEIKPFY